MRVLLADDETLTRAGCRIAIERGDGLAVVGEAGDGHAALALALEEKPDVIVSRIRPPDGVGLRLLRRVRADERLAGTRVILFGGVTADDDVVAALRAGARGLLLGDASGDELRRAVRAVAAGDAYLAPGVARRVVRHVASQPVLAPAWRERIAVLTQREREVVVAVAEGLHNEGIARRLTMSPATARTHVSRVLSKLGVHDRAHLVVVAYEAGLVSPGSVEPDAHAIYRP